MVTRAADLRPNDRPIDKDVKVPQAVLRAAAAADAAQRAAYPDQTPTPEPAPPTPAGDTIVIADPTPAPQPAPPAPVTPPGNEPPAPQPTPTPAAPQLSPEAELEVHRIRSEEGRKRAKLEQQLLAANDRLASLEMMVNELRTARPAPAPTPPPAPAQLISEKERDEFGTEMLDVMGRRAQEAISPQLAELRAMMHTIEQKVTGSVQLTAQTAREAMLSKLDGALPEWRQINVRPEFKAWLALPNPYASGSRHNGLLQAFEQNDTVRVLNFFNGFVSELAAEDPVPLPTSTPATPPAPPKPGLESLAAPGRARTSAQPNAPAEKQIITTADVNAFYDAVRKGFYNGREAEKNALEQELFAAQREGRVRAV